MSEYVYAITPGVANAETTPQDADALYVSTEELSQLYGCEPSEADIRAAMVVAHAYLNRPSLWPTPYTLDIRMPSGRNETRLPITPVLQILEAMSRYAPGRRDNQRAPAGVGGYGDYGTYLMLTNGGQDPWTALDVRQMYVDSATGMVTLPNTLLMPLSQLRITFVAGLLHIPDRIKLALFEIINTFHTKGQSDLTRTSIGRVSKTYASNSMLTPLARQLLDPWVVVTLM